MTRGSSMTRVYIYVPPVKAKEMAVIVGVTLYWIVGFIYLLHDAIDHILGGLFLTQATSIWLGGASTASVSAYPLSLHSPRAL